MGVKCFLIVPSDMVERRLRRYTSGDGNPCPRVPGQYSYHDASAAIDRIESSFRGLDGEVASSSVEAWDRTDERWPKACRCNYVFVEDDEWQYSPERLWRREDTGELLLLRDAPPGAMYDAYWYHAMPEYCGLDGRALIVKLPNGVPWHIDGCANNCTDQADFHRGGHKCWVRHGEPPLITVDKAGKTCGAGAGSILSGNYHGFLRQGVFT